MIDTQTGTVRFDNFKGHWGDQQQLNKFLQMYAVEKAKLEARKKGCQVSEQTLNDGSIKLQIVRGRLNYVHVFDTAPPFDPSASAADR